MIVKSYERFIIGEKFDGVEQEGYIVEFFFYG